MDEQEAAAGQGGQSEEHADQKAAADALGAEHKEVAPKKPTQAARRKRARRKRQRSVGALRDPAALEKLEKAADAVGLEIEELVDLVVDSGALTLPQTDGVTNKYTLQDLGLGLWTDLQAVPKTLRAKWYAGLADVQKSAVVVVLKERGYSTMTICQELGVKQYKVTEIYNRYVDELGAQVVGLRLHTIAGNLQLMAERAQQMAMQNGDASTFWRVAKDMVKELQSLGIVDRAIHKVEVTHKFDEQKQQEIGKMLEIERKKQARDEELKRVEVEVFDEAPPLEDYDT